MALNPADTRIVAGHTVWLARMGRTREALEELDVAVRRDPFRPDWFWELRSGPLFQEKRFAEVIESVHRMKRHAAEVLRLKPDYSVQWVIAQEPYKPTSKTSSTACAKLVRWNDGAAAVAALSRAVARVAAGEIEKVGSCGTLGVGLSGCWSALRFCWRRPSLPPRSRLRPPI